MRRSGTAKTAAVCAGLQPSTSTRWIICARLTAATSPLLFDKTESMPRTHPPATFDNAGDPRSNPSETLCREVDDDTAAHLALQDARRQAEHIGERHGLGYRLEPGERQVAGEAVPGLDAFVARAHDRIDAQQIDAAQQERDHRRRQVAAAGETAGGDAGAIFELCQNAGQCRAAD